MLSTLGLNRNQESSAKRANVFSILGNPIKSKMWFVHIHTGIYIYIFAQKPSPKSVNLRIAHVLEISPPLTYFGLRQLHCLLSRNSTIPGRLGYSHDSKFHTEMSPKKIGVASKGLSICMDKTKGKQLGASDERQRQGQRDKGQGLDSEYPCHPSIQKLNESTGVRRAGKPSHLSFVICQNEDKGYNTIECLEECHDEDA